MNDAGALYKKPTTNQPEVVKSDGKWHDVDPLIGGAAPRELWFPPVRLTDDEKKRSTSAQWEMQLRPFVSAPYGEKRAKHYHGGVDIPRPYATPLYAPMEGKVISRSYDWDGGGGYCVIIESERKDKNGAAWGYRHTLCHLSAFVEGLKVGDQVTKEKILGYVGDTGNATGFHVHWVSALRFPDAYLWNFPATDPLGKTADAQVARHPWQHLTGWFRQLTLEHPGDPAVAGMWGMWLGSGRHDEAWNDIRIVQQAGTPLHPRDQEEGLVDSALQKLGEIMPKMPEVNMWPVAIGIGVYAFSGGVGRGLASRGA